MTEKLYYSDSHLYEFDAVITEILERNGQTAVVLDRTAFFPTGGGQPHDEGFLDGIAVTDVEENDGYILHFVPGKVSFSVGQSVHGAVDGELRFHRMQSHSGEHIVSGVAHVLYGVENVGFHMDGLLMTVDFDRYLDKEQIAVLDREANRCVTRCLPVTAAIYTPEEAAEIDFRSKKDFEKDIRIVTVEGVDRCACCAPHVTNTGEIGLIKILSSVSHRGGVRLTLLCGTAAYEDYCVRFSQNLLVSSALCLRYDEIAEGVEFLRGQINDLKRELSDQKSRLCDYIVSGFSPSGENAVVFVPGASPEELRQIALGLMERCPGTAVVCSGSDAGGYAYAAAAKGRIMNKKAPAINSALNGRGGGRDELIQGTFRAPETDIRTFFESFEVDE